jgi:hypothetical protein
VKLDGVILDALRQRHKTVWFVEVVGTFHQYVSSPTEWIDPLGLVPKFGTGKGSHTATVTVKDSSGNATYCGTLKSGQMTEEEKALGFPQNTLATHTEARAVKNIPLQK